MKPLFIRFLGYELAKKNVPKLIGEGVEEEVLKGVLKIITDNGYIKEVRLPKAVTIGPKKFRFTAEIVYDIEV